MRQELKNLFLHVTLPLTFNPNKSVFVCFKPILQTSYDILGIQLVAQQCHKDIGILFSSDLTWEQHYKHILSKAIFYSNFGPIMPYFQQIIFTRGQEGYLYYFGEIAAQYYLETTLH